MQNESSRGVSPFMRRAWSALVSVALLLAVTVFVAPPALAAEEQSESPGVVAPGPLPPEGWKPESAAEKESPKIKEPVEKQQELEARAVKRWDALAKKDFDEAYTYETPSYRSIYSTEHFKGGFGALVTWYGARVLRVENLGNGVASVVVKVRFKASVPGINADFGIEENVRSERWVVEEGTWFHVTE